MLKQLVLLGLITSLILGLVYTVFTIAARKRHALGIKFMRNLTIVIILLIAIIIVLIKGNRQDISTQIIQYSSIIIAIATFSCQKVLVNVISGVMLSFSKPFKIGDKISLYNNSYKVITGEVRGMTLRHVKIRKIDGKYGFVANSLVDNYVIINENVLDVNGYPLELICSLDSDVNRAIEIMQECIKNNPLTVQKDLDQEKVTCAQVTDAGYLLKAIIFADSISENIQLLSELRIEVVREWHKEGINVN